MATWHGMVALLLIAFYAAFAVPASHSIADWASRVKGSDSLSKSREKEISLFATQKHLNVYINYVQA